MKYQTVCLLIFCASLISAERDFFNQKKKSNLFAPLSDAVTPLLFKGVDKFVSDILHEISVLSLSEQTALLSQLRHSSSESNSSLNFTLENISWAENVNFYNDLYNFIDEVTDTETLYLTSIQYNQEIQEISDLNWNNSLKYENYLSITRAYGTVVDEIRDSILMKDRNFVKNVYKAIEKNICALQTSPQQAAGRFLGHVGLYVAQEKLLAHLNTQIKKQIDKFSVKFSFDIAIMLKESNLYAYYSKVYYKTQEVLTTASQEFTPCLPLKPIKDSTYTILKNPFKNFTTEELKVLCHTSPRSFCNSLNGNADRFISLKPVYSNIYNNSVITGIRFVEKNHILQIQIQQGQLMKNGLINSTTVAWVPIDEDITCGTPDNCYFLNGNGSNKFFLGETLFIPNVTNETVVMKVLTGISITDEYIGHLRLSVYGTPCNFTEGRLIIDDKENTQEPGIQAYTKVHTEKSVTLTPAGNKYEEHTMTPFIDIQSVETNAPAAMVGAGVYTRSMNGNKLLSLKLFTYNFTSSVKALEMTLEEYDY